MTHFTLETTPKCIRSQFLLFALKEAGMDCAVLLKSGEYFGRDHLMMGPRLVVDGVALTELNVALRSIGRAGGALIPDDPNQNTEMELWLEHQSTWLRPAGVRIHLAQREGRRDEDAEKTFRRSIRRMNRALETREYLAGPFSLADCTMPFLFAMLVAGTTFPESLALLAYLERLRERPGWQRAAARWAELDQPSNDP
jgi:glutathione S-transferase